MATLESQMVMLQARLEEQANPEAMKEEVKKEIKDEFFGEYSHHYHNMLLDEISKHDPGMVIHGYNWTNGITVDQARAFCKDSLKFGDKADDLAIKSVTVFSKGKAPNPRMIVLVMLCSGLQKKGMIVYVKVSMLKRESP